jgi:hypothetical protein
MSAKLSDDVQSFLLRRRTGGEALPSAPADYEDDNDKDDVDDDFVIGVACYLMIFLILFVFFIVTLLYCSILSPSSCGKLDPLSRKVNV